LLGEEMSDKPNLEQIAPPQDGSILTAYGQEVFFMECRHKQELDRLLQGVTELFLKEKGYVK
jgi:hypothetical protein